jgi:RNA polymerase sigma-70 factor (ECF subfamily)
MVGSAGKVWVSPREEVEEDPSDAKLMMDLQAGDVAALGTLYRRHHGVVNAVVRRWNATLSDADAEDVTHEVFLTLMSIAGRYRSGTALRGWLCGIALNKAQRLSSGRTLRERLLSRFMRPKPRAFSPELPAEQRLDVQRVLDGLSPPLREVMVLSQIQQLSAEDVAQALNIEVSTVWTRLHRARERIRALLEGEKP